MTELEIAGNENQNYHVTNLKSSTNNIIIDNEKNYLSSPTKIRKITQAEYNAVTTDPFYAAGAKVMINRGLWIIENSNEVKI